MTTIDSPETYTGHPEITVALEDGVLSLTLNRPDSLNSLTAAMLRTLADALEQAAGDPGAGGPAGRSRARFCSGPGSAPRIRRDARGPGRR